jgi:hypothetical protein
LSAGRGDKLKARKEEAISRQQTHLKKVTLSLKNAEKDLDVP